jgi:hypothetical protein
MFENSILRRIFGPKRMEVTAKWKRLPVKAIHNYEYLVKITNYNL